MKIVIDIDEDMYKSVVNNDAYVLGDVDWILLENAIANGTPLPEHHGDLKDEREVASILLKYAHSEQGKGFANFLVSEIKDAPTIIEADKGEEQRMTPQETSEDFFKWLALEIMQSDEDFKDNSEAFQEMCCRKLIKLGIIKKETEEGRIVYSLEDFTNEE